MPWLYLAAAAAGALLGVLGLRVSAVLVGSIVLAAIAVGLMPIRHWSLLQTAINVFMLPAALQFSYLVAFSGIWWSARGRGSRAALSGCGAKRKFAR
jgi:hypothetical protein